MQVSDRGKAEPMVNPSVSHWNQGQICPQCHCDKLDEIGICGNCGYDAMSMSDQIVELRGEPTPPTRPADLPVEEGTHCPNCGVMVPEGDGEVCGNCRQGLDSLAAPKIFRADRVVVSEQTFCQNCQGCPSHNPHLCPGLRKPSN